MRLPQSGDEEAGIEGGAIFAALLVAAVLISVIYSTDLTALGR
jgi:hypothetical protein